MSRLDFGSFVVDIHDAAAAVAVAAALRPTPFGQHVANILKEAALLRWGSLTWYYAFDRAVNEFL